MGVGYWQYALLIARSGREGVCRPPSGAGEGDGGRKGIGICRDTFRDIVEVRWMMDECWISYRIYDDILPCDVLLSLVQLVQLLNPGTSGGNIGPTAAASRYCVVLVCSK